MSYWITTRIWEISVCNAIILDFVAADWVHDSGFDSRREFFCMPCCGEEQQLENVQLGLLADTLPWSGTAKGGLVARRVSETSTP